MEDNYVTEKRWEYQKKTNLKRKKCEETNEKEEHTGELLNWKNNLNISKSTEF